MARADWRHFSDKKNQSGSLYYKLNAPLVTLKSHKFLQKNLQKITCQRG